MDIASSVHKMRISDTDTPPSPPPSFVPPPAEPPRNLPPIPTGARPYRSSSVRSDALFVPTPIPPAALASDEFTARLSSVRRATTATMTAAKLLPRRTFTVGQSTVGGDAHKATPKGVLSPETSPPRPAPARRSTVGAESARDGEGSRPWSQLVEARMRRSTLTKRRFSLTALWAMSGEEDLEVDDALTKVQRELKELKARISAQSKCNFLLERDVRYLDSRIALLIQNRMALDEVANHIEDERSSGDGLLSDSLIFPDDRKKQLYSNLFFLLQTDPRIISHLTRLITLSEMDTLLQTVMFTLYGNQYDSREEHLLLTMFQAVLTEQFDSATDFGSLLRANTPVSRMMTTYTRRGPGQQYLKLVLSQNINALIEQDDLNLEMNPVKVYETMINQLETETGETAPYQRGITTEEAANHPAVLAIMRPRVEQLMALANKFLDTIIESLPQVPYGIRWICKQIKLLTKKKYPESSDWSICSLIGGFFFLRFINPAIVTPQSYMIVDSLPSKNARRNLTLIAKLLQNLANKPSYSKEEYMMMLNPFIENNKERIADFLMGLCDVDDFYETLELDQYVALSKKDLSIQISLNEMFNTHALLVQHVDTIAPVTADRFTASHASTPEQSYQISCNNLRVILHDLVQAPAQLPRPQNKSTQLPLFSRWESRPILFACMVDAIVSKESSMPNAVPSNDDQLSDAEMLYLDTKALLVHIIRKQASLAATMSHRYVNHHFQPQLSVDAMPLEFALDLINIDELLEKSVTPSNDPTTIKNSLRARQNLRILEDRYHYSTVSRQDGYATLCEDLFQEFSHLVTLRERISREIDSLQSVHETIIDHNSYLRSQIESYKAYLNNVRIQASGGMATSTPSAHTGRGSRNKNQKKHASTNMVKFSHAQLEKDGVIVDSAVPESRRANIYFSVQSPSPGSFAIGLHYKGREQPIVEVEIKLDDLLEKQQDNVHQLDMEYVQLNVNKMLFLLNKYFLKRRD